MDSQIVLADALEPERIFPLDAQDVVDHPVDERALTASGGAHQDNYFVIVVDRGDPSVAE